METGAGGRKRYCGRVLLLLAEMMQEVVFPSGSVEYYFGCSAGDMLRCTANKVFLTDENVFHLHAGFFAGERVIALPAGEHSKSVETITSVCEQLLRMEATRETMLVGVGGGVVTDIAGFAAAVYMRGIACAFVPTTLLAMVDASIGGKNGVNLGLHKNMIGTIRQPRAIYFDTSFLATLPGDEWSNGFAEVIKCACIFDKELFEELERKDAGHYKSDRAALDRLVQRCADWKNKTVAADELEAGQRRLLNFGHTTGHAIETVYGLPHGQAVAVGMIIAAHLGEDESVSREPVSGRLARLLARYGLPAAIKYNAEKLMSLLRADKKRTGGDIQFILLENIGSGVIRRLSFTTIERALSRYESNH